MLGLKDIVVTDIVEDLPAKLAADFDLKVIPWAERTGVRASLIVNTTPLGMKGKFENDTAYPAEAMAGEKRDRLRYRLHAFPHPFPEGSRRCRMEDDFGQGDVRYAGGSSVPHLDRSSLAGGGQAGGH